MLWALPHTRVSGKRRSLFIPKSEGKILELMKGFARGYMFCDV